MVDQEEVSTMNTPDYESIAGHWVGGYEIKPRRVYLEAHFTTEATAPRGTVSMKFAGAMDLELTQLEVETSRLHFEALTDASALIFKGQIIQGAIRGEVQDATAQGTFHLLKVAAVNPEIYDTCVGCYQVNPDRAISISNFRGELGCDYPVYLDFASRRLRALFPQSESTFVSGPSFLIPHPPLIRVTLVEDDQGEVAGLHWQEDGRLTWAPKVKFKQEEVYFSNGEVTLAGTLKIPLTQGPHPAAILLHGSGPQLRDHADLQFIADFFALNGIAVLAYDKRGTGASTRDAGETTLLDKAEDALAGLALLQKRDDINPHQIGLWGLSQGGWIAPAAAARSQGVAFIILVSGPAVGVVQQDLDRVEYELRASGFSAEEINAALAHQRLFSEAVATGQGWEKLAASIQKARNTRWARYVSLPSQEEFEQKGRRWGRFRAYDPLPYLEKTTCPVLAIFGEKDTVVPPEKNVSLMAEALERSGNTDYTIKVFPEANHTMLLTKTGATQEIPYRTHFVPGYFETVRDWLLERVEVRKG
jgi:pimeloyl-ACP methyl ester carboxylesterase